MHNTDLLSTKQIENQFHRHSEFVNICLFMISGIRKNCEKIIINHQTCHLHQSHQDHFQSFPQFSVFLKILSPPP